MPSSDSSIDRRRGHPVRRLEAAGVGVDHDRAVALDHEQAQRLGQDGASGGRSSGPRSGRRSGAWVRHRTKCSGRKRRTCPRPAASLRCVGRGAALITLVVALALALAARAMAQRAARPAAGAQRPARARPGQRADARQGRRSQHAARAAADRHAAARMRRRAPSPSRASSGRVPAGSDPDGLRCNVDADRPPGHLAAASRRCATSTPPGHECAFYDTALLFPTNALNLDGPSLGVAVLDMSDPAHPVQTDTLTEPPMLSPHESLTLNPKRGLLAAVLGNPSTYPGLVSIYDAHQDCRHPVLQSTAPLARLGHESGFSPDGKTFYATGTAVQVDHRDRRDRPEGTRTPSGRATSLSHGMTLSDDGNRAYIADPTGGNMLILDTSEIQARKPDPQAREISRLTWNDASIPQNAIPFTERRPALRARVRRVHAGDAQPPATRTRSAPARIIDIADERQPRVIVEPAPAGQPARRPQGRASGDPGTSKPGPGLRRALLQHPDARRPEDRRLLVHRLGPARLRHQRPACTRRRSATTSRPPTPATENGYDGSDYAMSQPAFVPARHEIWYSDGASGFYVLRVTNGMWPHPPSAKRCRKTARPKRTAARGHRHRVSQADMRSPRALAHA